jgi:hypothetical protein
LAVCYHSTGLLDPKDVPISGSALFDIQNDLMNIKIPWNQQFQTELIQRMSGTSYALLLVPKKIEQVSFLTMRDAEAKGARTLETKGGPP